jgi:hypothetical protein
LRCSNPRRETAGAHFAFLDRGSIAGIKRADPQYSKMK